MFEAHIFTFVGMKILWITRSENVLRGLVLLLLGYIQLTRKISFSELVIQITIDISFMSDIV